MQVESEPPLRPAPPFYILFKYIHEGGCILRSLLR
nr:MAG TPA: hypothetical protein [Caudoviricetes sp.]